MVAADAIIAAPAGGGSETLSITPDSATLPAHRDILQVSGRAARSGTLEEATRETMAQLLRVIAEAGSGPSDVVQVKTFLQPMEQWEHAKKAIEEAFGEHPVPPIVIVEVHMEATSEKAAMGHYLDGRVAAVVGTHTHVPTADARVLPGGTAFQTDLGMCGPWDSCIGRDKRAVVRHMSTAMYVPFDVGEGDERMCGAVVTIDERRGLATAIEPVCYRADRNAEPFTRALG